MDHEGFRAGQVKSVIALLSRVAGVQSEHQRMVTLLGGLCHLLGAEVAGLLIDENFRAGALTPILPIAESGWTTDMRRAMCARELFEGPAWHQEPGVQELKRRALSARPGEVMTFRRHDLVADDVWARSAMARALEPLGLDHPLYSLWFIKPPAVVQALVLTRHRNAEPFDVDSRELLRLIHTEWAPRFRTALRPSTGPALSLTPREAATLAALLRGSSVKEIAGELELSVHTVNQYVKAVYRAYSVRSRAELLARYFAT